MNKEISTSAEQLLSQLSFLAEVETYRQEDPLKEILEKIETLIGKEAPEKLVDLVEKLCLHFDTNTTESLKAAPTLALRMILDSKS